MRRVCYFISCAATFSSGQYAITDLIDEHQRRPTPVAQESANMIPAAQTGPAAALTPPQLSVQPAAGGAKMLMSALLGGQGLQAGSSAAVSEDSMAVVSGLIEAFMHKVKLQPGEKSCLENNIRQVGGDVTGTVGDIVQAVKTLIAGKGKVQQNAAGGFLSEAMDSAMKITSLVSSSVQLMKHCVHGDALTFLNMTAHHMMNGTYLEKRFIVNGVDIAHSLADTIVAYEAKDFHKFGSDIGTALRKILLSNAQKQTALPEGVPEQQIIQEATDGLMKGFFVEGSSLSVTDLAHPDIDLTIDLHTCIAGNSNLFKELWLAAWNLIAQLSVNAQQHDLGEMLWSKQGGQPKWEGELMVALMQFPSALANCGLDPNVQTMMSEAIQSLNSVRVKVSLPHGHFGMNSEADQMAKAVEAWTNWNFESFGKELGKLLRELVMLAFPRKYSIDSRGKLWLTSEKKLRSSTKKQPSPSQLCALFVIGALTSAVVALFVRRVFRTKHGDHDVLMNEIEESAADDVLVE